MAQNFKMAPMDVKVLALGAAHSTVIGGLVGQKKAQKERGLRAASFIIKVYSGKRELHESTLKIFKECFGMLENQGTIIDISGYRLELDPNIEYAVSFPLPASITHQMARKTPVMLKIVGSIVQLLPDILLKAGQSDVDIGQITGIATRNGAFYENNGTNTVHLLSSEKLYGIQFFGCHKDLLSTGNVGFEDFAPSQENWQRMMLAYLEFYAFPQQKSIPRLLDFLNNPYPFGSHTKGTVKRTVQVKGYATTFFPVEDQFEFPPQKTSSKQSYASMMKSDYGHSPFSSVSSSLIPPKESTAIVSLRQENSLLKSQLGQLQTSFNEHLRLAQEQHSMLKLALEEQSNQNSLLMAQLRTLTEMAPSKGDIEK
jgi:hypothetical protein